MLTLDTLSRFIPLTRNAFGVVSVFHRATSAGRKIFKAWDPADRPLLRILLGQFQKLAATGKLKFSAHCNHLKGAGGVKRVLTDMDTALRTDQFTHVCRSDAKSYYASIRHDILLQQLAKLPLPAGLQKWVAAYCQRTLHFGGLYAQSSRRIDQPTERDALLKTFNFLGMAFSRDGLCALGGTTPDRVREVTSQVYDRIVREVKQGSSGGQAETARPSQAELLRRVETYRKNWQRYLKGILSGFHQHRWAEAAAALYTQLYEQHRQLSSPQQWVTHFPLPRWQVEKQHKQTSEIVTYETKKKYYRLGGRCMHADGY